MTAYDANLKEVLLKNSQGFLTKRTILQSNLTVTLTEINYNVGSKLLVEFDSISNLIFPPSLVGAVADLVHGQQRDRGSAFDALLFQQRKVEPQVPGPELLHLPGVGLLQRTAETELAR